MQNSNEGCTKNPGAGEAGYDRMLTPGVRAVNENDA